MVLTKKKSVYGYTYGSDRSGYSASAQIYLVLIKKWIFRSHAHTTANYTTELKLLKYIFPCLYITHRPYIYIKTNDLTPTISCQQTTLYCSQIFPLRLISEFTRWNPLFCEQWNAKIIIRRQYTDHRRNAYPFAISLWKLARSRITKIYKSWW